MTPARSITTLHHMRSFAAPDFISPPPPYPGRVLVKRHAPCVHPACPHQLERGPGAQQRARGAAARRRTQAPRVAVVGALHAHARAGRDPVRRRQRVVGHLDHVPCLVAGLACARRATCVRTCSEVDPITCARTAHILTQVSTHPQRLCALYGRFMKVQQMCSQVHGELLTGRSPSHL